MKQFWNIDYNNEIESDKGVYNIKASNSFDKDAPYEEYYNLVKTTFTDEELSLIKTANLPYVYNELSDMYGGIDVWWLSTEDDCETSCECNPFLQDGKRVIFLTLNDSAGGDFLIFEGIEEFVTYLKEEFDCSPCNW